MVCVVSVRDLPDPGTVRRRPLPRGCDLPSATHPPNNTALSQASDCPNLSLILSPLVKRGDMFLQYIQSYG